MAPKKFTDFFKDQWISRPEVRRPAPKGICGCMEEIRARTFQSANYQPIKWQSSFAVQFVGSIYTIKAQHYSVILALYEEGVLLWLDDHSSDTDFAEFLRRENLFAWLPDRIDELVEVLVETKFSFLGWPRRINHPSDIKKASDYIRKNLALFGHDWVESILHAEKRIADIASRIHPLTYIKNENGEFQLRFYVWTQIFGQVIELNCFLGGNDLFRYEGTQLTEGVGLYTVPS
jgi:hypothetical protein